MMKASSVRLSSLKTSCDCHEIIESIISDPRNFLGGLKDWNLGKPSFFTKAAEKKVLAINTKLDKLLAIEELQEGLVI
jgi:hypothetical protein